MKIELKKDPALRCTMIVLSHSNEEISWRAKPFERTELQREADELDTDINEKDIFGIINSYWLSMPMSEQTELFETYREIKNVMISNSILDQLRAQIKPLIARLMDKFHNQDRLRAHIDYYGNIVIPENVADQVSFEKGSQITADKTYLREDYKRLVTMAVSLRAMVPIWGDYIEKIRLEYQNDHTDFKEFSAYLLLNESKFIHCVAMEKLRVYIENMAPAPKDQTSILMRGVSSDDYPQWMLARVLVRRACIGDVRGHIPSANIIRFIHQFVDPRNSGQKAGARRQGGAFGAIDSKFKGSGGDGDDETNLSRLEGYKTPTKNSEGDIQEEVIWIRDYQRAARVIDPGIPADLVEEFVSAARAISQFKLSRIYITWTQWVFSKVVAIRMFPEFDPDTRAIALGVAQAVLWHRRHYELAALMSSAWVQSEVYALFEDTGRVRITKEQQEAVEALFPYKRRIGNKTSGKLVNVAIETSARMAKEIAEIQVKLRISDKRIQESGILATERFYVPSKAIQVNIISAMLDIFSERKNDGV